MVVGVEVVGIPLDPLGVFGDQRLGTFRVMFEVRRQEAVIDLDRAAAAGGRRGPDRLRGRAGASQSRPISASPRRMARRSMTCVDGGSLIVTDQPGAIGAELDTSPRSCWSGRSSRARMRPVSISTSQRTLPLSTKIPSRPSGEKVLNSALELPDLAPAPDFQIRLDSSCRTVTSHFPSGLKSAQRRLVREACAPWHRPGDSRSSTPIRRVVVGRQPFPVGAEGDAPAVIQWPDCDGSVAQHDASVLVSGHAQRSGQSGRSRSRNAFPVRASFEAARSGPRRSPDQSRTRPSQDAGVAVVEQVARRLEHAVPRVPDRQEAELCLACQVPEGDPAVGAHGQDPTVAVDRRSCSDSEAGSTHTPAWCIRGPDRLARRSDFRSLQDEDPSVLAKRRQTTAYQAEPFAARGCIPEA